MHSRIYGDTGKVGEGRQFFQSFQTINGEDESTLPLKVGDELQVNLYLSPLQHVSAAGWVVRTERIEEKGKYVHSIGLEFLELKPGVRTQLRQAWLRARELGGLNNNASKVWKRTKRA